MGFACGHCFHLSHVQEPAHAHDFESLASSESTQEPSPLNEDDNEDESHFYASSRTVGPKVITARLIRDKIGDGCRICAINRQVANATAPENA